MAILANFAHVGKGSRRIRSRSCATPPPRYTRPSGRLVAPSAPGAL